MNERCWPGKVVEARDELDRGVERGEWSTSWQQRTDMKKGLHHNCTSKLE
jgi:hypothetical protein